MNPSVLVLKALLRQNRPVIFWVLPVMIVVDVVTTVVIERVGGVNRSLWFPIAYTARYWCGVAGILLVVGSMRTFLANGISRRDYTLGAGMFGALMAVAFATVLGVGQVVERWAFDLAAMTPNAYEALSFGAVTGRVLPIYLAFLVSGALIGAAYYRFGGWLGTVFVVPASVPTALADWLLGFDGGDRVLSYPVSVLIVLAGIGLAAVALRLLTRHVAVRLPAR